MAFKVPTKSLEESDFVNMVDSPDEEGTGTRTKVHVDACYLQC